MDKIQTNANKNFEFFISILSIEINLSLRSVECFLFPSSKFFLIKFPLIVGEEKFNLNENWQGEWILVCFRDVIVCSYFKMRVNCSCFLLEFQIRIPFINLKIIFHLSLIFLLACQTISDYIFNQNRKWILQQFHPIWTSKIHQTNDFVLLEIFHLYSSLNLIKISSRRRLYSGIDPKESFSAHLILNWSL